MGTKQMPNMCKGETRLLSLIASVTQAGADAQEKWVNREKKDPQNAIFQYLGNFAIGTFAGITLCRDINDHPNPGYKGTWQVYVRTELGKADTMTVTTNIASGVLVRQRWNDMMVFYDKYLDGKEALCLLGSEHLVESLRVPAWYSSATGERIEDHDTFPMLTEAETKMVYAVMDHVWTDMAESLPLKLKTLRLLESRFSLKSSLLEAEKELLNELKVQQDAKTEELKVNQAEELKELLSKSSSSTTPASRMETNLLSKLLTAVQTETKEEKQEPDGDY
jgi:hypothetical protein